MEYSKFKQLVSGGETAHVDFKITCEAFASQSASANAELAKDICAMANNGNIASYIMVGISDDGTQFKSVENSKLTDDNIQDFCKKCIYPPPRVKVHCLKWEGVLPAHSGKEFVVIQVGPQARRAFRLNQDFINYKEGFCYRRNEVWIRRGATSDLATPEEIAHLIKGEAPIQDAPKYTLTTYAKLPQGRQITAVVNDFRQLLDEIGGETADIPFGSPLEALFYGNYRSAYIILPIRSIRFVWRSVFVSEIAKFDSVVAGIQRGLANEFWKCEHGVLIFNMGIIRKSHYSPWMLSIHYKTKWGWFTILDASNLDYSTRLPSALQINRTGIAKFAVMALSNITSTVKLRDSFVDLINYLEHDDAAFDQILQARDSINEVLKATRANLHALDDPQAVQVIRTIDTVLALSHG